MIGSNNLQISRFSAEEKQSEHPDPAGQPSKGSNKDENSLNYSAKSNFSRHSIVCPEIIRNPLSERAKKGLPENGRKTPFIPLNTIATQKPESADDDKTKSQTNELHISPDRSSRHSIFGLSPAGSFSSSVRSKNMSTTNFHLRCHSPQKLVARRGSLTSINEVNWQETSPKNKNTVLILSCS